MKYNITLSIIVEWRVGHYLGRIYSHHNDMRSIQQLKSDFKSDHITRAYAGILSEEANSINKTNL